MAPNVCVHCDVICMFACNQACLAIVYSTSTTLMSSFLAQKTKLLQMFIVVLSLSFLLKWLPTVLVKSCWFLNLLSNQDRAAIHAAQAWFDRILKNHRLSMQNCSECKRL